ncbi:hypothetical protein F4778DRAFT_448338 [Xylariomycetidae sp. FL2044]|nr:hypothetical protein F4778DRAFT_448338 [Xylariomycetidae sp. FL2044]
MPATYRIYVRHRRKYFRFTVPQDGCPRGDEGQSIFTWLRQQTNIDKLKSGARNTYEVSRADHNAFHDHLMMGVLDITGHAPTNARDRFRTLVTGLRRSDLFALHKTGVHKLEEIADAGNDVLVMLPVAPRTRYDAPGWLYMINLDEEILEVYQFKDYKSHKKGELKISTLFRKHPEFPPGYYIRFSLGELSGMRERDWKMRHQLRELELAHLWQGNRELFGGSVRYARDVPFAVLYGSATPDARDVPTAVGNLYRTSPVTEGALLQATRIARAHRSVKSEQIRWRRIPRGGISRRKRNRSDVEEEESHPLPKKPRRKHSLRGGTRHETEHGVRYPALSAFERLVRREA